MARTIQRGERILMRTELEDELFDLWNEGLAEGEGGNTTTFGMAWARVKLLGSEYPKEYHGDYLVTTNSDGVVMVQDYDPATWQTLEVAYSDWMDHDDYVHDAVTSKGGSGDTV